ncbi:hypothetical protein T440DRAFT_484936 [Plenodomus tracheiphilus IPT5]|uniref:Zn(2)-C6 fungal-type domain-containing protein n=1 Tax=Plenodomus tracheiphilus IPT5 TaxID=1408161 RepID=A0A6A7BQE4_9PLEO|nr:hypothetical protein T440DRAFT_484936 [Plenodomus tracheiphilus IPT5]
MRQPADATGRERSASHTTDTRPAKRNRITVACTSCRQRKSRCNGSRPICDACAEHGFDCLYSNTGTLTKSSASEELVVKLESRVATVEEILAQLSSRVSRIEDKGEDTAADITTAPHVDSFADDTVRLQDPTDGIGSIVFTEEEDSGFFGPTSNIAFTHQVVRTTTGIMKHAASNGTPVSSDDTALKSHVVHMSHPASPVHNSHLFVSNGKIRIGVEPFILPPEDTMMQLIDLYFSTAGTLFPYIDRNGFLRTYRQLVATNILSVRRSWLGLLNMVFAVTTNADNSPDPEITAQARAEKANVFYHRAMVLSDRQIRYGTSLEVVQMLLLASMYSQGTERSIETWNTHGLAVKAAYQLGIHSPDALRQYPPPEREMRKRVWFGCVVLDRTLSMTMGRPVSIPESFVKVGLPQLIEDAYTSTSSDGEKREDPASVQFFAATIILYRLMSEVFDLLYGSNVGLGGATDVFDIASHLLQYEQKFVHWQHSLPASIPLISEEELTRPPADFGTANLRVVLTSRFLNLRILTHRPLLCKYLEIIGSSQINIQQLAILHQVGANSVRICVQSANSIIQITRWALQHADAPRQLLGAWWFSLYYAFNAALVIYSALLIQHQAKYHNQPIPMEEMQLSIESLYQAIDCMSRLYKGNRMIETCVRYTSALAHRLTVILQIDSIPPTDMAEMLQETLGRNPVRSVSTEAGPQNDFDFSDPTDLYLGLELGDLWQPLNPDFLTGFIGSTFPDGATFER